MLRSTIIYGASGPALGCRETSTKGATSVIVLLIGLSVLSAYLVAGTALFGFAVANAVGSFWGNGVMANFADNPQAAPNWATAVSMVTALLSVIFIASSFLI